MMGGMVVQQALPLHLTRYTMPIVISECSHSGTINLGGVVPGALQPAFSLEQFLEKTVP